MSQKVQPARRPAVAVAAGLLVGGVVWVGVARPASAAPPAAATTSSATPTPTGRAAARGPVVVRVVAEARGRGRRSHLVTRIDLLGTDGSRRRIGTVRQAGVFSSPVLSPDRRRVAFVRGDGRIALVAVGGGRTRLLRPPGLPRPRPASAPYDPTRLSVASGAPLTWSADGRTLVVHGLLLREPPEWAGELAESRSVACTVASRRCTSAGPGAPADLVPLAGGRTLRIDGPITARGDAGRTSLGLRSARQERLVLARRRDPLRTVASIVRDRGAAGTRRVLARLRGTTGRGVVALGTAGVGPAGVLVRRTSKVFRPSTSGLGDGASVDVTTRVLPPWVVTPGGRLRTLPVRLAVDPIGALADGRWLVPTADVRSSSPTNAPEPGLAVLDRRGRTTPLRVGGQDVTPVRLALAAGLPDGFAAGAQFQAAWVVGGDLLVELLDSGSDGLIFFPADAALVRLPLDGSAPASLVDHEGGASYVVR